MKKYFPRSIKSMNLLTWKHGKIWKQKYPSEMILLISQQVLRGKKSFPTNCNLSSWHDNEEISISCYHLFWRNWGWSTLWIPGKGIWTMHAECRGPLPPKWMLTGCSGSPKKHLRSFPTTVWIWGPKIQLPPEPPHLCCHRHFQLLMGQKGSAVPDFPRPASHCPPPTPHLSD